MAKGLVSQGVCLLSDGSTTLDGVRAALKEKGFNIVKEARGQKDWQFSGPSLVVSYRPEVNGYVAVDVVEHVWPDAMGDPKSDSITFGAWSMGQFGPLTFPGGLARAGEHSWAWQEGPAVAQRHRGFLRIRLSYVFGAKDDGPVMPADYDPLAELMFLSRVVLAVLTAPGILCYFNSNGEVLRDGASFRDVWKACEQQQKIPLLLWMNVRFFHLNDRFGLMDTVGNGQLDRQDVEAIFPKETYDPGIIDYYLRNVTHYLLGMNRPLQSGEAIDGPGETNLSWTTDVPKNGVVTPPRRMVRLFPKADRKEIQQALTALGREA
jgi:hypothetical protein